MINPPTYPQGQSQRPADLLPGAHLQDPADHDGGSITPIFCRAQISTLDGVAQVPVTGASKYAVRIQADPNALAARGIGIDTLANAINDVNVNQATGSLNGASDAQIIHTDGQLANAAQFRKQIIAYSNGAPVRLGDVANVIDSSANIRQADWYRTRAPFRSSVQRQPGANTIEVVQADQGDAAPASRPVCPPASTWKSAMTAAKASAPRSTNVQETLLIAAALVVGVIFIFLRKVSATIIPALALPIAVIGTFAGMAMMGFSLDNLSLMALTLSVGFVVDDAIVMLENIVRHIEMGESPTRRR